MLRTRWNIPSQKKYKNSNQHWLVGGTQLCSRNNANTFKLKQTITNKCRYRTDQWRNVVDLSKHSFSFDTYTFLHKNLNLIPTSKSCNKNQLSLDLQNVFQLIKLTAHFQDEK